MGKITRYSQLSPKKRLFVDYYLKGYGIADSYFAAGYMSTADQKNKDKRLIAYRNGQQILSEPIVKDFVAMNRPVVVETGEIDVAKITDRLMMIFQGNIEQRVVVKDKVMYVLPSFRDQIEAGKLLNAILEKREKKAEKRASKALSGKVVALIGKARVDETDDKLDGSEDNG